MTTDTQPTSEQLLKCPFCGWDAEHRMTKDTAWPHIVRCTNCWAQTDEAPSPDAAGVRWNMRVAS